MRQMTFAEIRQELVVSAEKNEPKRTYSLADYLFLFLSFSFAGWCWELVLRVVQEHKLVNGGTLFGPWLPIYGFTCLAALVIVRHFAEKPLLTFFVSGLFSAVIEYGTAWFLEWRFGLRWWDYSGIPLNLSGYICLPVTVLFALGCMAVIYFLAPCLTDLFHRLPKPARYLIAAVGTALILLDFIYVQWHPHIQAEIVKSIPM